MILIIGYTYSEFNFNNLFSIKIYDIFFSLLFLLSLFHLNLTEFEYNIHTHGDQLSTYVPVQMSCSHNLFITVHSSTTVQCTEYLVITNNSF